MIKYSIKKHKQLTELNNKDIYVLWLEGAGNNSFGCRGIFQGTKQECEEKLKEIKSKGE